MSPARLWRSALPFVPIASSSLPFAGLPPNARETLCVEIRPRLKKALQCAPTAGEISISFDIAKPIDIGVRLPGGPSSGTIL